MKIISLRPADQVCRTYVAAITIQYYQQDIYTHHMYILPHAVFSTQSFSLRNHVALLLPACLLVVSYSLNSSATALESFMPNPQFIFSTLFHKSEVMRQIIIEATISTQFQSFLKERTYDLLPFESRSGGVNKKKERKNKTKGR